MYRLYATLMCLIIFAFLFTQRPVVLIVLISAFEAPVLSVSAIMLMYLFRKKLAKELRPGYLWYGVIICGTIVYLVLSIILLIKTMIGSS